MAYRTSNPSGQRQGHTYVLNSETVGLPERRPTATEVICWVCRPVTSFASLAERRSQKRSVPSKCPLTASVPSAVMRTALTEEWHGSVLVQKPLPRSQTCTYSLLLFNSLHSGTRVLAEVCHESGLVRKPIPRSHTSMHEPNTDGSVKASFSCLTSRRVKGV